MLHCSELNYSLITCFPSIKGVLQDEANTTWKNGLGTIRWKGALMQHPFQLYTSSCGVTVIMVRQIKAEFKSYRTISTYFLCKNASLLSYTAKKN